jgi:hypothetical protein
MLFLKNYPESPEPEAKLPKAYIISCGKKDLFIMGLDLSVSNPKDNLDVSGFGLHHHEISNYLVFAENCSQYAKAFDDMQKTEKFGKKRDSELTAVIVWNAKNIQLFANQLMALEDVVHIGRTRVFVAVDIKILTQLSHQFSALGCAVSVVEEMHDNPRITDEEIYGEHFSYKNSLTAIDPVDARLHAYTNQSQMVLFGTIKEPEPNPNWVMYDNRP